MRWTAMDVLDSSLRWIILEPFTLVFNVLLTLFILDAILGFFNLLIEPEDVEFICRSDRTNLSEDDWLLAIKILNRVIKAIFYFHITKMSTKSYFSSLDKSEYLFLSTSWTTRCHG